MYSTAYARDLNKGDIVEFNVFGVIRPCVVESVTIQGMSVRISYHRLFIESAGEGVKLFEANIPIRTYGVVER